MTYREAVSYIESYTWSRWKLGLERTVTLLARLGNPQKQLRFVHVAGSNGKGSTCAMIERILREAGYKTGFYPSPYIEDFRERIRAGGEYITEEALSDITARVAKEADAMEDHPTQFELITAIGMVYFAEQNCDPVVLETGLGGEYDATNVIDAPEVAVLTNIGLEHTEYLGGTLAEITKTKAGIIKPGADVVLYENVREVTDVVRGVCEEKGCPLHIARHAGIRALPASPDGQRFLRLPLREADPCPEETGAGAGKLRPQRQKAEAQPPDGTAYTLALAGAYQLANAATALTVIDVLRGRGFAIPEEAVRAGLANVTWPARFEVLSRDPLFILDGGHNPQCAQALAEAMEAAVDGSVTFLIGVLADKDYHRIIDILAPYAAEFICVTPDSDRALPAGELAALLTSRGFHAVSRASVEEGVERALAVKNRPVIAFGSLYMAGTIRKAYRKITGGRKY